MDSTNQETGGDQERESDGSANEHRSRTIQGECHDSESGELYALSVVLTATDSDDLATLPDRLSGVFESAGLECSVSLRSTSRAGDWDGR